MGAGHGNDLRLFDKEVVGAVITGAEQLKRTELIQLSEDATQVTVAPLHTSHRWGREGVVRMSCSELGRNTFGELFQFVRQTSAMSISSW